MRSKMRLATSAAMALGLIVSVASAEDVEVLHWWTAGGEAAALNVLKEDLAGKGIGWQDMPVAGGGGEAAMTALRARVTSGNPPTAVQMLGFDILDWVNQGDVLANLDEAAAAEGWDAVIPAAIQKFSKPDGHWIAAPVNVHSTNWVWANKAVLDELGIALPTTWDEFIANCAKFKEAGIDCVTTGTKALWPAAGIFDYLDLRTNGYDFHMALTNGEVPWTDDRVKATFTEWAKLVEPGYVVANHAAVDWQDAAALLVQGKAANFVIGNFAVPYFKDGGMTDETLGFMPFPTITPDVPRAELAPIDSVHITAGAKNPDDAKKFLAYLATAEVQTKINEAFGQLPINKDSEVGDDPYLQAGFELLSTTEGGIAQFFDRDAPAEMAKIAMEGFQQFMIKPDKLDSILERLEAARGRVYK